MDLYTYHCIHSVKYTQQNFLNAFYGKQYDWICTHGNALQCYLCTNCVSWLVHVCRKVAFTTYNFVGDRNALDGLI